MFTINVKNGTINIIDKTTDSIYENVLLIEDGADDGDEYDFSQLKDVLIITNKNVDAKIDVINHKYSSTIEVDYKLAVPKDLESRKAKLIDGEINVKTIITVNERSPFINVEFNIDNQAKDHRVRVYVPTNIASKFSISDNQFGSIKRNVYDDAMDVWEKEDWDERPDSIYPMLSYVTLSDKKKGIAVLTNSTREYEIIGESYDTIAITLFRCVGFLGKEEMLRRPGRPSGIKLETPDSQMIGKVKIQFALYLYKGEALEANVSKMAKEYLTPIKTYNKMPHNAMKLNPVDFITPYNYSLFKEENKNITLSTVKKSEKNNGLVIRFFNGSNKTQQAIFELKGKSFSKVNLNEELISKLEDLNNIECKKNTVESIYVEL
ncbi:glycoside hydrolase family 38 C-terminal domain-containing protein [Clostridium sp. CMCC3678]|uniref:glycoside hydrolase family 38 C-terminal domain-containing protein n=1 Tax=Clostridium sp. CMCC3678 TaxID=2949962 RepID=UPI00338EDACE